MDSLKDFFQLLFTHWGKVVSIVSVIVLYFLVVWVSFKLKFRKHIIELKNKLDLYYTQVKSKDEEIKFLKTEKASTDIQNAKFTERTDMLIKELQRK